MAQRVVPIPRREAHKVASLVGPQAISSLPVEIVDSTDGPVTWRQKLTGYYKGLVALTGAALIMVNQVAPIVPPEYQQKVTAVIAVLTFLGVVLKENQHWIEGPPVPSLKPPA